jgi:hypothetical protein
MRGSLLSIVLLSTVTASVSFAETSAPMPIREDLVETSAETPRLRAETPAALGKGTNRQVTPNLQSGLTFSTSRPEVAFDEPRIRPRTKPAKLTKARIELANEQIVEKIQTVYMFGLQRCYQHALTTNPALGGKVTLMFTVATDGSVKRPTVSEMTDVDACVRGRMKFWKFDEGQETQMISLTLALQPS